VVEWWGSWVECRGWGWGGWGVKKRDWCRPLFQTPPAPLSALHRGCFALRCSLCSKQSSRPIPLLPMRPCCQPCPCHPPLASLRSTPFAASSMSSRASCGERALSAATSSKNLEASAALPGRGRDPVSTWIWRAVGGWGVGCWFGVWSVCGGGHGEVALIQGSSKPQQPRSRGRVPTW